MLSVYNNIFVKSSIITLTAILQHQGLDKMIARKGGQEHETNIQQ